MLFFTLTNNLFFLHIFLHFANKMGQICWSRLLNNNFYWRLWLERYNCIDLMVSVKTSQDIIKRDQHFANGGTNGSTTINLSSFDNQTNITFRRTLKHFEITGTIFVYRGKNWSHMFSYKSVLYFYIPIFFYLQYCMYMYVYVF